MASKPVAKTSSKKPAKPTRKAQKAEFVTSAAEASGFAPPNFPEIAFVGRSNVGKSSLINFVTGQKGLAKTSSTPGRTRLINWFRIKAPFGRDVYFVDLPGYGFANVPVNMRRDWQPLIESYIVGRETLRLVLVLVDARRGPEPDDATLLEWLAHHNVAVQVVLTKIDKLSKSQQSLAVAQTKRILGLTKPPCISSTTDRMGLEDMWRVIAKHLPR